MHGQPRPWWHKWLAGSDGNERVKALQMEKNFPRDIYFILTLRDTCWPWGRWPGNDAAYPRTGLNAIANFSPLLSPVSSVAAAAETFHMAPTLGWGMGKKCWVNTFQFEQVSRGFLQCRVPLMCEFSTLWGQSPAKTLSLLNWNLCPLSRQGTSRVTRYTRFF